MYWIVKARKFIILALSEGAIASYVDVRTYQ